MRLKQFIFALVAMLMSFSLSVSAETTELLVSSDYNSSTEGYGTSKFSNYAGAYAYATANATNATIVIEKTTTLSGNTFNDDHENYSKLAVVIKDGATMGNALSKWDMTYPVTVEPGGTLTCARPISASVSNIHIKNTLTVGAKGATKKAVVDFLSDTYQDCDISIRYNGKVLVYNADFRVQDLDAQGSLTIEDSKVEVDGAFASATFFQTTLTNTEMTVNGNLISGGLSDFAGGDSNQLGKVTINNSTLTIKEGTTKVAANVTAKNSTIDVNELIVNTGKTLNLNEGSTLEAEYITLAGTATVKVDGVDASVKDGVLITPKGNDFTGYTRGDAIWGEVWGNATESFVIKVLDANGNVMGTTSLNNIGGIINGDVNVTWSLKFDADSNTDEYWTMEWTTAPTIDKMPAKVELWVDGVKVSGGDVVLNAPDNLNKIYAAVTDASGKILSFHTDVQEAIKAAAAVTSVAKTAVAGTVEFLDNVTVDKWIMFAEKMTVSDGSLITLNINGVTIDGNGKTLTVKSIESAGNGGYLFYDAQNLTVKDLTINIADGLVGGIGLQSGTISNVTFNGGQYAVLPGSNGVTIDGCEFNDTKGYAVYYENERPGIVVTGNTFNTADGAYAITMRNNEQFTNNTVVTGRVNLANSAASTVSGNDFGTERFKVYNDATATISNNKINNLVFNATDVPAASTFTADNTLSAQAQAALDALPLIAGEGTEANPYLISNKKELMWFRDKVDELATDGSTQFAGKYFKLTADIDLAGENWNPIGSMSGDHGSFKGVFDGGDHTIYNLKVEQAGNGIGLFARTADNAVIKNLNLNNVSVKSTDNSNYVGAVVGNAYASTKIENVHVSGNVYVSGRGYIGGIAGHGYVVMDNVSVVATGDGQGNDKGLITSTFWCAGGILGYAGEGATNIMNANVENVVVTSAAGGLGAIVGMAEDNNGTQPISGSNLSAKDVEIKTYIGAYGDSYANYALGYLYGGNPTSKLTGELSVENVTLTTSNGVAPTPVDAVAKVNDTIYFSLQKALDAAQPSDIVTILAGDYTQNINVNKAITVVGETDAEGNNLVNITGKLNITADGATVKNLNVNNGSSNGGYINAKDVTVEGCQVVGGNGFRSCYTTGNVTFRNSVITGSTYGIHFDGSAGGNIVIDNCTITGWTSFASTITNVALKDTKFEEGNYNQLRFYQNATLEGCTFNEKMNIDFGKNETTAEFKNCTVENDGKLTDVIYLADIVDMGIDVTVDGEPLLVAATIGETCYLTLAEAVAAIGAGDVVIELLADVTFDYNARDAYGTAETTSVTINGNGHTLTLNQKDSDWASIGLANAAGKLVLNGMTIEKTGYGDTSGAWNTHAIIFSCPVEMTDVTVNQSMAVQAGATLNNVTINEANGYYGLWINGNGQSVTVNGGAINATNGGRGIKIADEYIDAPAQVTLNVTGTEFNTAKKAAVLVSSTAGANITASNVDIANVAEDSVNFVWVDEDWAANYGAVEVTGATVAQESVEQFPIVVKNGDKIVAYFKNLDDAIAAAENGATITVIKDFAIDEMVTVAAGKELTIDLNGKTITGTDNTSKNFSIIDNRGNLTIKDSSAEKSGKITLTATIDSDWNRYSAVIANNPGGKLTIDGGTLEHLGGTDMAYGIDNLTNGKGTYAETVINGGTIKSTYRGIRQFLNGIEAQNILTINGGTVEGANKSVWMQDPNKNANTGALTVGENAKLVGDVYLYVTPESTSWPVEVSIAIAALQGEVITANVPAGYELAKINNAYCVALASDLYASINGIGYKTLAEAITAAQAGDVITFLQDITENVTINKNVTIDGAGKQYTGTMTGNSGQTITVQNVNFVNGGFDKSTKSTTGTYTIKDCTFDGAGTYAYAFRFKGANKVVVENCTVKDYLYSFLYVTSSTNAVSVKNVTVENCSSYAVYFSSGVTTATFENLTVKNSNNGFVINNTANRAFTIEDCKMENVTTAINYADGTNTITCTALGVNDFGGAALCDYAVIKGATITDTTYYGSVKGMVEKAETGQTVQLLSDITLNAAGYEMASCDGYPSFVHVEGKAITVDLNGKRIDAKVTADDVSNFVLGVFSTGNGGELTLVDNSDEGTGTVKLEAAAGKAYSLLCNYEDGCKITINGGTYFADNVRDCLVYSGGKTDAIVTVNGGNFTLGNVGAGENGKPWIFNVLGAGDHHVLVKGGTFNADINRQHWSNEVYVAKEYYTVANADSTAFTVKEGAVAYVNMGMLTGPFFVRKNVGYATLGEAFAAADDDETVTLLKTIEYKEEIVSVNGEYVDGLVYTGDKNFTVDFAGHMVTENGVINDYLVYLKNTGEKDNEITFKNGKIAINSESTATAWAAITVGSGSSTHVTTLNLENMEVINGNPNAAANMVIRSRNGATVNLNEGTTVTSNGTSYGVVAETASTLNINDGAKVIQQNSGTTGGNLVYTAVSGNGTINIYDGAEIVSDNYGIHNMTTGNTVINIYGGTITAPVIVRAATNGGSGESADVYISGGTFFGAMEEYTDKANIHVSGGVFDRPVDEKFCAVGYAPLDNENGTYGVYYALLDNFEIIDGDYTEFENLANMTVKGKLTYERELQKVNAWQAFYVPFELPVDKLGDDYDVVYINNMVSKDLNGDAKVDTMYIELIDINYGTLKANYPYLIRAKNEVALSLKIELENNVTLYSTKAESQKTVECSSALTKFEFVGTYNTVTRDGLADKYGSDKAFYGVRTSTGNFAPMSSTAKIAPFRLYMVRTEKDGSPVILDNLMQSIGMRLIGEENEDGTTTIYDVFEDGVGGDNMIYDLNGRRVLDTEKGGIYITNGKKVLVK